MIYGCVPEEGLGGKRLSEEVRHVVARRDIRVHETLVLHQLPNIKVTAFDVLRFLVMLGIVGEVASAAVVCREIYCRSNKIDKNDRRPGAEHVLRKGYKRQINSCTCVAHSTPELLAMQAQSCKHLAAQIRIITSQ